MAEIVVNLVVNKLCDAVLQEIFFLCGVREKVERVKREMIRIQCFLKDADRKRGGDEGVKHWVNELRELSHWIEDTVDLFVLEVEESSGEYPGAEKKSTKEKMKGWFKKPEKVVCIRKFGKEIDKILEQIDEIAASREKYGIENLVESNATVVAEPIIPELDETELVGVGDEKEKIIHELLDEKCLRRSVVSIVGPGGLGKSTVAAKVYTSDAVKRRFDLRIWLSISQNFTPIHLLKKILEEIGSMASSDDKAYLMKEVNKLLQEKMYLIVMDDVWSEELWPQIAPALPDVKNGSRVLITSRFLNVPIAADPGSRPNELRLLTIEESLKLLRSTALRNRAATEDFVAAISDLAEQLARKCDGLPLALVVLGGVLSRKPLSYHAWEKVSRTMSWSDQGKRCMDILTTSYDDMSVELKSCFMYLACFPEDYQIEANDLIRLWVAEGLIPHKSSKTLDDVADEYLEELVQRSMIEVSKRSLHSGSIQKCRVHDLLRDVAIQKAKEDNFMMVCSNQEEDQSSGGARRLAVHYSNSNTMMKYASPNLRTLYCFDSNFPDCSRHKRLKVLSSDFGSMRDSTYHYAPASDRTEIKWFEVSHQLRYLLLDEGTFLWGEPEAFDKLIGKMKFLQTLNLKKINGSPRIPDSIWHIKTLRHIMLPRWVFTLGPPPLMDNKNLLTLQSIKSRESWEPKCFPALPNLCLLNILVTAESSWESVVTFLRTLQKLKGLLIDGSKNPIDVGRVGFQIYNQLTSLTLVGSLVGERLFDVRMFPTHLTKLSLKQSNLMQGDLTVLESFRSLKKLTLRDAYSDQIMWCSSGGFPCLLQFELKSKMLQQWEIEVGAMPKLKELRVEVYSNSMRNVPRLQHLTNLRKLIWTEHSRKDWFRHQYPSQCAAKAEEIRNICQHVPSISISGLESNWQLVPI